MLYKIGDVAKILGISPDIMRYYEKKGIVKPHKDSLNDYRYYEVWDVNFLIECLWFKQYDFGMKDIAKIISDSSYDELRDTLKKKQEELEIKIIYQQQLLARLKLQNQYLDQGREYMGKCDIQDSPEMIRYLNRYNFLYDDSEEVQKLGKQWLAYFPFISRCFDISLDVLMNKGTDFAWGFSMLTIFAEKLSVKIDEPVEYVHSCKCLHSVFKQKGKYGFSPQQLEYITDYAKEDGLKICGHAIGNLLCSVREDDVMTGYFEVWIPIE